ncbi:MAG TPA: hypothetical protein PLG87_03360 [Treponemataceae bacterium]|jgi:uncharacterized integral membrane protein|nr:hypothetical protein [Treponemataceae bacterium]
MPWKLIFFILVLILATLFIGFNLDNACNVSFGVYTFENVPVFMSILLAFAAGILVMIPFLLFRPRIKPTKTDKSPKQTPPPQGPVSKPVYSDPEQK